MELSREEILQRLKGLREIGNQIIKADKDAEMQMNGVREEQKRKYLM